MDAALKGQKEIAGLLIAHGADVNAESTFGGRVLAHAQSTDMAEFLKAHGAEKDKADQMMEAALSGRADVDAKDRNGWTALMWAADEGQTDVARQLLEKGADVNSKDKKGRTALMLAGSQWTMKLLLEKGADVDAKDDEYGQTALMEAAVRGDMEEARLLLEKGADVNAKDNDGWTALMEAAQWNGGTEIARLLLEKGADANARTNDGRTALDIATKEFHPETAALLRAKTAK
jgi:ankyrin repeat protein